MKAALLVENGKPLVLRDDLATPEPTGTQVLVETTFCGVCHSDLHIWEGKYDLGGGKVLDMQGRGLKLPLAMGHEVVGRVAKLGPDAKGVEVGAEYLVYPWVGCDNCALCRAGSSNMCLTPRSIGVYAGGGYATHVIVPNPSVLLPIPANVDKAVAATYACSGVTVYSAISKVKPLLTDPEEPLVLVGAGGLGLNAVSLLQALGHKYTVVMDIDEGRLKTAEKAGAKKTVDGRGSAEEVVKRIVEACGGTAPVAIIGPSRQLVGHCAGGVPRPSQRRQAGPGRPVWRIARAAVAADADQGLDHPRFLRRQPEGAQGAPGSRCQGRRPAAAGGYDETSGGGERGTGEAQVRRRHGADSAQGVITSIPHPLFCTVSLSTEKQSSSDLHRVGRPLREQRGVKVLFSDQDPVAGLVQRAHQGNVHLCFGPILGLQRHHVLQHEPVVQLPDPRVRKQHRFGCAREPLNSGDVLLQVLPLAVAAVPNLHVGVVDGRAHRLDVAGFDGGDESLRDFGRAHWRRVRANTGLLRSFKLVRLSRKVGRATLLSRLRAGSVGCGESVAGGRQTHGRVQSAISSLPFRVDSSVHQHQGQDQWK